MRVHPKYPHIFATGGDERDLCIWDIRRLFCSADGTVPLLEGEEASLPADPAGARKRKGKKANAEAELLNEADSDASHPPAEPVSGDGGEPANSIPVLEPLWEAKNVRNDFLDMRVPVWITTIEWLSTETYTRLVTGTGHHQVRVFDTKKQRRPILDVSVGDHPVRAMAVNASKTEVLLADTTGQMVSISIDTGKVTGKFLGIAGAVAQIHACERSDVVISVGIDRKARLFEGTGKRRILREIYLKQRLSALLVDENWVDNSPDEQEEASGNDGSAESTTSVKRGRNGAAGGGSDADDEDDDAMWDGIPVVGQDDGRSADTKSARANKSAKAAKASKAAKPAKAPKNAWQVADRPAPDGASAGAAAKKQRKA
nr:WD repeat-containing protein 74 [Polyrhizophydium stewartii]